MRDTKSILGPIVTILAVIGAVNWGLIGFFNFNLVDAIFGGGAVEETSTISRVIYALVGLAGVATLFYLPRVAKDRTVRTGETRVAGARA